jgi:WD40 repeat protein
MFSFSKGISTEEIIAIEYVLLPDTPEEKEDIPHEEWVSAVAVLPWSDRASWVLSGSYDKCARVWTESGELLALLQGHDEPITGTAWAAPRAAQAGAAGAAVCVTSSKDHTLRSFAVEGGEWAAVFRYTGHEDAVQVTHAYARLHTNAHTHTHPQQFDCLLSNAPATFNDPTS